MRIDGLPNLPSTQQTNQRSSAASKKKSDVGPADVVDISSGVQGAADLAAALKAAPETNSDQRLDEIRARVQSGYYNSDEVRQQIAGALLQSDGLRGVAEDVTQVRIAREKLQDVPDVREDRVSDARQRASTGFYDQNQVRSDTADRVLDEMA